MRSTRAKLLTFVFVLAIATLIARKRGYTIGGDVVVRCSSGHLFTTIWIPGASVKALRLGWFRFQYCPVGAHWALVKPVREADLASGEVQAARAIHDVRVP
jgi:hypothetical protein